MYLGSVKFYKHLIYFIIVTVSILALIGLGFLISLALPSEDTEAAANQNNDIVAVEDNSKNVQNNGAKSDEKAPSANTSSDKDSSNTATTDKTISDNKDAGNKDVGKQAGTDSSEQKPKEESKHSSEESIKTAYLTFDDGPSENTEKILEILRENNVKATFFVVTGEYNAKNLELLKKIYEEGHSIGIHSHSHEYEEIYDSVESFFKDLDNSIDVIYNMINLRPNIVRLPGGSINAYNIDVYQGIIDELSKRNFKYYDWNVSFDDAKKNASLEEIVQSAMYGIEQNKEKNIIMLAHDQSKNSAALEALEKVIDVLETYGYSFSGIDDSVEPITFLNKLDTEKDSK